MDKSEFLGGLVGKRVRFNKSKSFVTEKRNYGGVYAHVKYGDKGTIMGGLFNQYVSVKLDGHCEHEVQAPIEDIEWVIEKGFGFTESDSIFNNANATGSLFVRRESSNYCVSALMRIEVIEANPLKVGETYAFSVRSKEIHFDGNFIVTEMREDSVHGVKFYTYRLESIGKYHTGGYGDFYFGNMFLKRLS